MLEGIALDRLGLEGEAEYALRAARQAFVLLGDRHREVDSLVHMATFFEKCGQIDDALDLLDWAAETYASGGDEFRWARVSVNRATILAIHRGEFTEAAGVNEEAAKIFERHGAAPEAALAWNNLGAVMHFRGLLDDARSHYEKARDLVADHELRWVFAVATTNPRVHARTCRAGQNS